MDIFEICPTPEEFINYSKFVSAILWLQETDENDFFMEKYSGKIMKKKKVAYWYYFNFILNFIPSDMYFFKLEKYKHKEERKDKGEKSSSDEEDAKNP